jgi:hypothetical protein
VADEVGKPRPVLHGAPRSTDEPQRREGPSKHGIIGYSASCCHRHANTRTHQIADKNSGYFKLYDLSSNCDAKVKSRLICSQIRR